MSCPACGRAIVREGFCGTAVNSCGWNYTAELLPFDESDPLVQLIRQAEDLGLYDMEIKPCHCGNAPPCRHHTGDSHEGDAQR